MECAAAVFVLEKAKPALFEAISNFFLILGFLGSLLNKSILLILWPQLHN